MFRKLNQIETDILAKKRRQGKVRGLLNEKRVRYDHQNNFTVCVLKVKDSIYTGVAKFNPTDPSYTKEVGERLAFSRAVVGH